MLIIILLRYDKMRPGGWRSDLQVPGLFIEIFLKTLFFCDGCVTERVL